MPETRFGEMAGTGIIKSGTMFTIDPVQKLRIVTVTERLTVPDDTSPNSAASIGYVKKALVQGGHYSAGDGLSVVDGALTVAGNLALKKVTLSQTPEQPDDAATVSYVNAAVSDKTSKTYVDFALEDIRESYITKEYVEEALAELSTQSYVNRLISDSEAEVRAYVDESVSSQATDVSTVKDKLNELATSAYVELVIDKIDEKFISMGDKIQDTVSRHELEGAYALKTELAEVTQGLPSKSYVKSAVSELVDTFETQLDSVTEDLADKNYVDTSVAGFATTDYVDTAIAAVKSLPSSIPTCQCKSKTQYVRPNDDDTILIDEDSAYLLIDADSALNRITLDFSNYRSELVKGPQGPQGSQVLAIATSRDIENVIFEGFTLSGDVERPERFVFTAGSSLRFLFVQETGTWFVV